MIKKGVEINFALLFAILAGSVILFLAIYGASKLITSGRYQADTITAKQMSIIFEPLETGLASGLKPEAVVLKDETRIYNACENEGVFGSNSISLSASSSFGKKWQKPGAEISIPNKYIFSDDIEQGKTFYYFSKPFNLPFKVSELIFLSAEKYCFEDAPDFIINEVNSLQIENIKFENCTDEIKVCFQETCDITVSGICTENCDNKYDYGFVSKNGENVFYTGSLIYAAIFSNKNIYECNVKRLASRLLQQALLLQDESNFISGKCQAISMIELINSARQLKTSRDLLSVYNSAKNADEQNDNSECRLW